MDLNIFSYFKLQTSNFKLYTAKLYHERDFVTRMTLCYRSCSRFSLLSKPKYALLLHYSNHSSPKLIINKKLYDSFKPIRDSNIQNFVNSLSQCSVTKSENGIEVIELKGTTLPHELLESSEQFIYTRTFYPELLQRIRSYKDVVLLSNPGTGKSMFQFYYLARLFNPSAFPDPLPCDDRSNVEPPEVVIRQVGTEEMQVFFVKARKVHVFDAVLKGLFRCFNPKTTLYFFEPADTKVEPLWKYAKMNILATCSPDIIRYKEFCKGRAEKLYMPLFTLEELLTIGAHMCKQPGFPKELLSKYSDDSIRKSYAEYGGVIRHVLPRSSTYADDIAFQKRKIITNIEWKHYLANPIIEGPNCSHFVVKYIVDPPAFEKVSFDLVSDAIEAEARLHASKLRKDDMISMLKNLDRDVVEAAVRPIYEIIVSLFLVEGRKLLRLDNMKDADITNRVKEVYSPKLRPDIETIDVTFDQMKEGVLYKPADPRFPLVDFYYKEKIDAGVSEDGFVNVIDKKSQAVMRVQNMKFVGINTCIGLSEKSANHTFESFDSLKSRLQLPDELLFEFVFCPNPKKAFQASAAFHKKKSAVPLKTLVDFSILVIPESFAPPESQK